MMMPYTRFVDTLTQLFENSFQPVLATDAGDSGYYRIVYANPAFLVLTGYAIDELLGRSPSIFQGPRSNKRTLRKLKDALIAQESFTGTSFNYKKNGDVYPLRWNITPYREQGEVVGFFSVQRDLSDLWNAANVMAKKEWTLRQYIHHLKNAPKDEKVASGTDQMYDFDGFELGEFFDDTPCEPLTQTYSKVSASDYMANAPMEADDIVECADILYTIQHDLLVHIATPQDESQRKLLLSSISELSGHLNHLIEFESVAASINELSLALHEESSASWSQLVFAIVQELIEELIQWFNDVFVNQTSKDIHFKDASIIASAKQVKVFIGKQ